jgi:hypothetical protein
MPSDGTTDGARPITLPPELSPRRQPPRGRGSRRPPAAERAPRPAAPPVEPRPAAPRRPPRARRGRQRWLLQLAGLALLLAGVAAAVVAAVWMYRTVTAPAPPPHRAAGAAAPARGAATASGAPAATPTAGQRHPAAGTGPVQPIRGIQVFDPVGQEARNYPSLTVAPDGRLVPPYVSEIYRTANFGALKPGVGLLVDLGTPRLVGRVEVAVSPGAVVQLRTSDVPAPSAAGYRQVAGATTTSGVTVLRVQPAVRRRYWLLWITQLPAGPSGGYQISVRSIQLR